MLYVFIDPGGRTGLTTYDTITRDISLDDFPHFEKIHHHINLADVVIYEAPYQEDLSLDLIVYEVKGAIVERCLSLKKKIIPQPAYTPSTVEKWYGDWFKKPKLKGMLIHRHDALCHLIFFVVYKQKWLTIDEVYDRLPERIRKVK